MAEDTGSYISASGKACFLDLSGSCAVAADGSYPLMMDMMGEGQSRLSTVGVRGLEDCGSLSGTRLQLLIELNEAAPTRDHHH